MGVGPKDLGSHLHVLLLETLLCLFQFSLEKFSFYRSWSLEGFFHFHEVVIIHHPIIVIH